MHKVITSKKKVITKGLHSAQNVSTMYAQPVSLRTRAMRLFFSLLLVFTVGYVGSAFVTPEALDWYDTLILSNLTPPNHWFGIIWGFLYFLMACSMWLVWGETSPRPFVLQLACNLVWPFLFFHLHSPIMALAALIFMIIFIGITIWKFSQISIISGALMIPVLLWSCFAFYLNLITVVFNTKVGVWLGMI